MIGGDDEKKTLRLVAKYADACNLLASPDRGRPEDIEAELDVLREHCAREGTDYDRLRKTVPYAGPLAAGTEGGRLFAETTAAYAELGVSQVHVRPPDDDPVAFIRDLGLHVVPLVAALGAAVRGAPEGMTRLDDLARGVVTPPGEVWPRAGPGGRPRWPPSPLRAVVMRPGVARLPRYTAGRPCAARRTACRHLSEE